MVEKVAVLYIHGMGVCIDYEEDEPRWKTMEPDSYIKDSVAAIKDCLPRELRERMIVKRVYWANIADKIQQKLINIATDDVQDGGAGLKDWRQARYFLTNYLADTIFYQYSNNKKDGYHKIHEIIALEMKALARDAGIEAPLVVIAHSLGTAIISNYLYDLQHDYHDKPKGKDPLISPIVRRHIAEPKDGENEINLMRGDTLMYLFTLGSPLAVYNTRYDKPEDFGLPINVPSKSAKKFFSDYPEAEGKYWFNYFEDDDIIGFPLESLSSLYAGVVKDTKLRMFKANPLNFLTPLSHKWYWTNNRVVKDIAAKIEFLLKDNVD